MRTTRRGFFGQLAGAILAGLATSSLARSAEYDHFRHITYGLGPNGLGVVTDQELEEGKPFDRAALNEARVVLAQHRFGYVWCHAEDEAAARRLLGFGD